MKIWHIVSYSENLYKFPIKTVGFYWYIGRGLKSHSGQLSIATSKNPSVVNTVRSTKGKRKKKANKEWFVKFRNKGPLKHSASIKQLLEALTISLSVKWVSLLSQIKLFEQLKFLFLPLYSRQLNVFCP